MSFVTLFQLWFKVRRVRARKWAAEGKVVNPSTSVSRRHHHYASTKPPSIPPSSTSKPRPSIPSPPATRVITTPATHVTTTPATSVTTTTSSQGDSRTCDICQKVFRYPCEVREHKLSNHSLDKHYVCTFCGTSYANASNLYFHIRRSHRNIEFKCDVCYKEFKSENGLKYHRESHKKEHQGAASCGKSKDIPMFCCGICGMQFHTMGLLRIHIDEHQGTGLYAKKKVDKPKGYICHLCSQNIPTKKLLLRHMTEHSGKKPFKCDKCNALFSYNTTLTAHKKKHSEDNICKCDVCGKHWSSPSKLEAHYRTHTQEKPFSCRNCNTKFVTRSNLNKHVKRNSCGKSRGRPLRE